MKEGKGPLPMKDLEEEFKALWKVPFNLQQAGETDALEFLSKWPNKVEVTSEDGESIVQLASKSGVPAVAKTASAAPPAAAAGSAATATLAVAKAVVKAPVVKAPAPAAPPAGVLDAKQLA